MSRGRLSDKLDALRTKLANETDLAKRAKLSARVMAGTYMQNYSAAFQNSNGALVRKRAKAYSTSSEVASLTLLPDASDTDFDSTAAYHNELANFVDSSFIDTPGLCATDADGRLIPGVATSSIFAGTYQLDLGNIRRSVRDFAIGSDYVRRRLSLQSKPQRYARLLPKTSCTALKLGVTATTMTRRTPVWLPRAPRALDVSLEGAPAENEFGVTIAPR